MSVSYVTITNVSTEIVCLVSQCVCVVSRCVCMVSRCVCTESVCLVRHCLHSESECLVSQSFGESVCLNCESMCFMVRQRVRIGESECLWVSMINVIIN